MEARICFTSKPFILALLQNLSKWHIYNKFKSRYKFNNFVLILKVCMFNDILTLWLTASTRSMGKRPSSRVLLKVLKRLFLKLGSMASSYSYSSTFFFTLQQA